MQVVTEELNPCTVMVTVTMDVEEVNSIFDKAVKDLSKTVRIPGFRPGSAPKELLRRHLDPAKIKEQAARRAAFDAFRKAMDETGIKPYGEPVVDFEDIEEGQILELKYKTPLEPKVTIGNYKGICVAKQVAVVSEEEIDNEIEGFRRRDAKLEEVTDRGAQPKDYAVVTFMSEESGDPKPHKYMIEVGNSFGALDQALTGMLIGETKTLTLTYPEDFQITDWAGKPLETVVTLDNLKEIKLPELDDQFAIQLGAESLDKLRQTIKEHLLSAAESKARSDMQDEMLDKVLQVSEIHVPDTMWEDAAEKNLADFVKMLQKNNHTLESYAAETGGTVETLKESFKEEAKKQVLRLMAIKEIAKLENIEATSEDLADQVVRMAYVNRISPEEMRKRIEKEKRYDELLIRVLYRKVLELLEKEAIIAESA